MPRGVCLFEFQGMMLSGLSSLPKAYRGRPFYVNATKGGQIHLNKGGKSCKKVSDSV